MFRLEGVDGMVVPGNQYESSPQGLESFSAIVLHEVIASDLDCLST